MAKPIHSMIRVIDEQASVAFYQRAFGMSVKDRFDFSSFTLVYLVGAESRFELELTINKDRTDPYDIGDGYGHIAFAVNDLRATHAAMSEMGFAPRDIVEFKPDGSLLATFFFVADPDGYQIEVMQAGGRYQ